jgi:hypothetical protein
MSASVLIGLVVLQVAVTAIFVVVTARTIAAAPPSNQTPREIFLKSLLFWSVLIVVALAIWMFSQGPISN